MAQERLIIAIGRIERALTRLEQMGLSHNNSPEKSLASQGASLLQKHERLKTETRLAIRDIDALLHQGTL